MAMKIFDLNSFKGRASNPDSCYFWPLHSKFDISLHKNPAYISVKSIMAEINQTCTYGCR